MRRIADPSGALIGELSSDATSVTGFVAVWTGRPGVERFANLATRGFVAPDQPPMVAGFFFEGPTDHSFLLRAAGPTLADYDIQNPQGGALLRIGPRSKVHRRVWVPLRSGRRPRTLRSMRH